MSSAVVYRSEALFDNAVRQIRSSSFGDSVINLAWRAWLDRADQLPQFLPRRGLKLLSPGQSS